MNEPAFPQPVSETGHSLKVFYKGMTLRDYFAAKAMQTLVGVPNAPNNKLLAILCYEYADAMLKERSK